MPDTIKLFPDNELFNDVEIAGPLRFAPATLRNSRNTGILAGVPAPKHIKRGRSVLYWGKILNDWHQQFESPESAEATAANG